MERTEIGKLLVFTPPKHTKKNYIEPPEFPKNPNTPLYFFI
jgi:hypothetical protein